jgi:putative heme-binding domain-containing protein
VSPEFLSVDWGSATTRGNVDRGRKLFSADALGCAKCHAIRQNQKGGGGPSLADAAKRFTVSHLVEAILTPSQQVAPVFGTTSIITSKGETLSGLVVAENDRHLTLLLPTAQRREVSKSDIDERKLQNVSPMPSGLVKTPAELSDLLAYLLSADPPAP